MKIQALKAPKQKYLNSEFSASEYIPYKCHWNQNTIMLKDDSLMRVIKITGFSFETADDEDIDIKKQGRNNLLKGMASGNFALWFHTIRRREKAFPAGEMTNIFTEKVNEQWKVKHDDERTFVNEHYISIIRREPTSGLAKLGTLAKTIKHKTDKATKERDLKEAFDELEEMTERILNGFSNYGAELLGIVETEAGYFSKALEFLGMIANCGTIQKYRVTPTDVDKYLCTNRMYFGPKTFEVKTPRGSKYGGVVSLKEYRPATNAGILDGFLQLPFEFIISQSFSFVDRMIAISSMQLQQRRLVQSEDVAVSQIQEIDQALDAAMSGLFAFGHHHLTISCVEDSIKSAENALSMLVVELANVGITGVRERMNMEATFWGQLPGNFKYLARKSTINTLNLASFASFHNYPFGKRKDNHWGDAVTVFNTVSGTPYFFSFHVRDVGHTMIVGPTGSGKTVLMNFLCAQAQKFKCRMFFFDKDRGAEIFIRALGGKYIKLDASKHSGFNPLALPETNENKTFLVDWIKAMVSTNNETITATDMARIKEAIDGNYKLPFEKRRLRNIAAFLGISGPGTLAGRLEMWHTNESHSKLFDNKDDEVDFFSTSAFGFDMTELLKDKVSIGPVLLYLFHRINSSLDGTPTIIILDEAWALIDNPIFAPRIKDWLKVLRKLNAFVVFATQSVEDATKSAISDTLVQQTATQIYLPNLKATEAYRKIFMLSEREFQLVKTTDPATRFFLVKQDNNGVIARIDLTGMNDIIRILSGRVETVQLLDEIIQEVGSDDPEDWIEIFYKRARKI
ncbi:MAG: type IV secretion system protein VirB4 [Thermoplasmata archaeon M8B2D]|nr:MAG: type IV secretion system protein VirB4 [Thermoplasmata archaeon M8B2D]